ARALDPASSDVEGVFVVRGGRAEFVPVQVGIAGRDYFEILSGLSEGDSIVSGPYETIRSLRSGQMVRPMRGPRAAGGGAREASQCARAGTPTAPRRSSGSRVCGRTMCLGRRWCMR